MWTDIYRTPQLPVSRRAIRAVRSTVRRNEWSMRAISSISERSRVAEVGSIAYRAAGWTAVTLLGGVLPLLALLYWITERRAPGRGEPADHGETGGKRLEHDVPERFGDGGEHEQVGAGVAAGELLPFERAGEDRLREPLRQRPAHRALAHDHQLEAIPLAREHLHRLGEVVQVLLAPQAPHVEEDRDVVAAELGAQLRAAERRRERRRIHAPLPQGYVVDAVCLQLRRLIARRGQGEGALAVEAPRQVVPQALEAAQAVVAEQRHEVRVEARHHRDAAPPGVAHAVQTEQARCDHVDDVRAEPVEQRIQGARRRQAHPVIGIQRERD